MILLASIIDQFEDRFFDKYKKSIRSGQRKALYAMKRCRMKHGPHMLAQCTEPDCGQQRYIPHSCGHRNCPHCQNHENSQWIENQLDKLLPAQYFLLTFTLPAQFRELVRNNRKTIYTMMFSCVQEVLKTFIQNDKKLGGKAGFTAVLHTHSRAIEYHPHIHVVMPAASINPKTGLWKVKSTGYLFSHKALAKVFRAKLLQAIVDHGLKVPKKCPKHWVVDCRNVGKGDKTFIYLGRYLYRGVIREQDILKCENGKVTFRYLHAKSKKYRTRTVAGEYFLYLLLQHVLPRCFRKVRCYGFLHPCSKKLIKILQMVLQVKPFTMFKKNIDRAKIICPACGGTMQIIQTRIMNPDWSRVALST